MPTMPLRERYYENMEDRRRSRSRSIIEKAYEKPYQLRSSHKYPVTRSSKKLRRGSSGTRTSRYSDEKCIRSKVGIQTDYFFSITYYYL